MLCFFYFLRCVLATGQQFQCKMCDYQCDKEVTLNKHTNTKHQSVNSEFAGEKRFYCHQCNVSFKTKKSLKKHETNHNDAEKLKECNICANKFKSLSDLEEHMTQDHQTSCKTPQRGCIHCTGTDKEVCDGCLDEWIPKGNDSNESLKILTGVSHG